MIRKIPTLAGGTLIAGLLKVSAGARFLSANIRSRMTDFEKAFLWALKLKGTQSQRAQLLTWLLTGKPVTPLLALQHFGCMRLAARIAELIAAGYPIVMRMITATARDGRQVKVAEYRMEVAA